MITEARAAVPAPPLGAARRARKIIQAFANNALSRIVGYGLLALFALDLIQLAIAYRPFQPEADAILVTQMLDRIAVPLLAYALIFSSEMLDAHRLERTVQKLLSIGSLVWVVVYFGLAVLAVSSGVRLYNRAALIYQQQAADQTAALRRVSEQAQTLTTPQLQQAFNTVVRRARGLPATDSVPPDEMRRQLVAAIPGAIETVGVAGNEARSQAKRTQIIASGKSVLGGVISAVLFLLIWEATSDARAWRIFRHRHAPSMEVEDRMASAFQRTMRRLSEFSPFPRFNDYRWYRHLRRAWQRRREKW